MPRFGTEMRQVDRGHRIVGQQPQGLPGGEPVERPLRPQHRQRAAQPARIDLQIGIHRRPA